MNRLFLTRQIQQAAGNLWPISDTFTRANSSSTLGNVEMGGLTWGPSYASASTWGVSSNKAYCVSASTGNAGYATIDTGRLDNVVEATVTTSASRVSAGLCVRGPSANNAYGVLCRIRKNVSQGWDYVEMYNGSSFIAQLSSAGMALGTTYTMRVEASGNNITVFINGVQKITASSGTLNSAGNTRVGLLVWSSANDDDLATRWDDFRVKAA